MSVWPYLEHLVKIFMIAPASFSKWKGTSGPEFSYNLFFAMTKHLYVAKAHILLFFMNQVFMALSIDMTWVTANLIKLHRTYRHALI